MRPPFTSHSLASPACYLCFWMTGCKLEVSMSLFWGSINLLEWLIKLEKPVYSLDYGFIVKNTKDMDPTAREERQGQGPEWSSRRLCPCAAWGSLWWKAFWFPNLEALREKGKELSAGLFMAASLCGHDWLSQLAIDSTSSPSLLAGQSGGRTESFNPLTIDWLHWQPVLFFRCVPQVTSLT